MFDRCRLVCSGLETVPTTPDCTERVHSAAGMHFVNETISNAIRAQWIVDGKLRIGSRAYLCNMIRQMIWIDGKATPMGTGNAGDL